MTTADEVLHDINLSGRRAVVTGGYSGVGLAITRALTRAGAHVTVPARRPEVARRNLGPDVDVEPLDLADLTSVDAFAERYRRRYAALDLLVASAGIMACPETRVGPGWEAQFAVNHLGHFAVVCGLWPALVRAPSARVVAVASGRSPEDRIRWDDTQFTSGYDKWAAYGQSKLANVLFALHLDRLGAPYGVRAFSAAPGYIRTPLQRHLTLTEMIDAGWLDAAGEPLPELFRTPEEGAATPLWAAVAATRGGAYCAECREAEPYPHEEAEAARLWQYSAALTGRDLVHP
ncbi:SDR family NAD(P)-dependent oxidoreductase [Cryptosporangium aurantiacum]|uniref:NAD(P)-dependent dehydrogenase, short-chain alcohol dehydrogenase family n=1 Tax=Cryptosporangium aurantiacum TaxID=134849 RepID=A0A1M7TW06_9ACTN|nr:SDR family NAD(P)-dependent oxidoreductase [Cryptosporangium aurantiacum]SHN74887.1 NAD(P)-dependent dehydrogenase, short-chain alcohol dehydrogenase family [Cryptosporangium aurantiacum]